MQKKSLLATVIASVFSIVAFAADGVYTATAQGQSGPVPISVTVKDNKVTRIEVGPNKETVGIGAVAGPKVAQRILDAQSLAVDGVSGATVTSNAVKKATREAITQAGLNLKDWDKKPTQKAALKEKTITTDVLILGGGGAGMISAINASDQGVKVTLLEKMEFLGGASSICAGGLFFFGFLFFLAACLSKGPSYRRISASKSTRLRRLSKICCATVRISITNRF